MTLLEYKEKLIELEKVQQLEKVELMKSYVGANNPYKIGDRVSDHSVTIEIESMGFDWGYGNPCASYLGVEINKDGKPNKRGNKSRVWQSNIVKN